MIGLNQALSCPTGSLTDALGESNPVFCPIIYCPSTENVGHNYTASICVKVTSHEGAALIGEKTEHGSQLGYDKTCFTKVCGFSCNFLKSEEGEKHIIKESVYKRITDREYNITVSVGCQNGDFRSVENQTMVLPESTIKTFQTSVNRSTVYQKSSTDHSQANLAMPLFILFVILLMNNFIKRH